MAIKCIAPTLRLVSLVCVVSLGCGANSRDEGDPATSSIASSLSLVSEYGNTMTVSNGSPIPSGWVIISVLANGQWVIEDLNGGSYRSSVTVINGSPLPAGWAIASVLANTQWVIEDLNGGSYGNSVTVINESPLPTGWAIASVLANAQWVIEDLNGGSYRSSVTVINGSPLPTGWAIASVLANAQWVIEDLNGGSCGNSVTVINGSPLPTGWAVVSVLTNGQWVIEDSDGCQPPMPGAGLVSRTSSGSFFFSNGTGYYGNAAGHYCAVDSWPQWVASGAPLSGYPVYAAIPSSMVSDGQCLLPQGFFFDNGTGYYGNAAGHYCAVDSWPQWVAAGAPLSGYPVYPTIPSSMVSDGQCLLPQGFFFDNGTGYYANTAGHYCAIDSWPQWVAAGAPLSGYPVYPTIPSSMVSDGQCTLHSGYFYNNGTRYYANAAGHYCAAGGPSSGTPTFAPIPTSMIYDGVCGG